MNARATAPAALDVEAVRRQFPVLGETVYGRPLVYLDSAASAQKPRAVIDAESAVYERSYANIHRGVHRLSVVATEAYEEARRKGVAIRSETGATHLTVEGEAGKIEIALSHLIRNLEQSNLLSKEPHRKTNKLWPKA